MTAANKLLFESDVRRLEDIKTFILANLGNELKAAAIAFQFKMSESTLHRQFRAYMNSSLHQFILKSRMEKAKELIGLRALNINQIGILVGYNELSSFTRAFKKYFGQPPKFYLNESNQL